MNHRMGPTFPGTWGIEWRAHQILKRRRPEEITQGQKTIRAWIDEWAEQRLGEEINEFIKNRASELFEDGGWELEYLRGGFIEEHEGAWHLNVSDIQHLLENWPDSENLPSGYPTEITSDLDVLLEILSSGYPYDGIEGFYSATEAEIYAVIALDSVNTIYQHINPKNVNPVPPRTTWKSDQILKASEIAVDAMEMVCAAERHLWDEQIGKMRIDMKNKEEQETRKKIRSEMARAAAVAKLATDPKQVEKQQVQECWDLWQKDLSRYKGDTAFARDMLSKYENLKSIDVITRWCRQWESTTKPAK